MYSICNNRRERNECPCPCHLDCQCINEDFMNKSEIFSNINIQNPNTEYFSSNCINNSPLYNQNYIYNYSYSPNINNQCKIRKMRLRERAQSLKDKINSKNFIKCINNPKNKKNYKNSGDNNFDKLYTFQPNLKSINQKKSSYIKNKINNINEENKYLNQLLSKVPRHEKGKYNSKYFNKLRFSFSSDKLGGKPNNFKCFIKSKKYQGYSSMVMPPNDLDNIVIKNSAYT